jgi:hypothetical protein
VTGVVRPQLTIPAPVAQRSITCALLSPQPYWPGEVALACPGLEVCTLAQSVLGPVEAHNPFQVPVVDKVDVALVGSWWYSWLADHHPDRVDEVLARLERSADVLVGLNGPDRFNLDFPPRAIERFASVLCLQGLYRDRDLYNYAVGPKYPGANWTEKSRPGKHRYRASHLEKLKLAVPSFVTEFPGVRAAAQRTSVGLGARLIRRAGNTLVLRGLGAPLPHRPLDVHCLVGFSHVQRLQALQLLEGFSGLRGIAMTQSRDLVYGTEHEGAALPTAVQLEIAAAIRPYEREPVNRFRYLIGLRRHKIGVAPTGYGEVAFRHAQVMMAGAVLVCQDLGHVEMLLPLTNEENAMFCRPDLSDLAQVVETVLEDDGLRGAVARQGRRDVVRWSADWKRHLEDGFEGHIRESL